MSRGQSTREVAAGLAECQQALRKTIEDLRLMIREYGADTTGGFQLEHPLPEGVTVEQAQAQKVLFEGYLERVEAWLRDGVSGSEESEVDAVIQTMSGSLLEWSGRRIDTGVSIQDLLERTSALRAQGLRLFGGARAVPAAAGGDDEVHEADAAAGSGGGGPGR